MIPWARVQSPRKAVGRNPSLARWKTTDGQSRRFYMHPWNHESMESLLFCLLFCFHRAFCAAYLSGCLTLYSAFVLGFDFMTHAPELEFAIYVNIQLRIHVGLRFPWTWTWNLELRCVCRSTHRSSPCRLTHNVIPILTGLFH